MYLNRKFHEEAGDANGGEGAGTTQAGTSAGAGATPSAASSGATPNGAGAGPTWPTDWRKQFAGEDEAAVKRLERFAAPTDVFRSYRALEQRVSSGELKNSVPFPDKGTPEEQTAWRVENGIPESPDKYQINLGEGIVIGEEDKPVFDDFLKHAHAKNMPSNMANAALQWYEGFKEKSAELRHKADQNAEKTFEDTMRSEWGNDYRPNLNSIHGLLDLAPEGVKDNFLNGRLADGTPIGSDPDTLRWLANLSRQINPITTVVPGAGANISQAIGDELAKLDGMMANRGSEYWKGPNAEKNQARYRQLLDAQSSQKGR